MKIKTAPPEMDSKSIYMTRNYSLFNYSPENRVLCVKKHAKLEKSMKRYGFLSSFPISVMRDNQGKLTVKDGQHRLAIAEHLNLPVYWIEEDVNYDVAIINGTAKTWTLRDYAEKWAMAGKEPYIQGLKFADDNKMTIGNAFALLAGTVWFSNVSKEYEEGTFVISDLPYAEMVALVYTSICELSAATKNNSFLHACMAVCRVDGIDIDRMVRLAEKKRELLVSYSKRDLYLEMLEEIYNFGQHQKNLVPLKMEAMKVMRQRARKDFADSSKNELPQAEEKQ